MLICRFKHKGSSSEAMTKSFVNDLAAALWCSANKDWYCVAIEHK